jgi:hypothetical protein
VEVQRDRQPETVSQVRPVRFRKFQVLSFRAVAVVALAEFLLSARPVASEVLAAAVVALTALPEVLRY